MARTILSTIEDDAVLLRLARDGDPAAFDEIVRRHARAAFGLAQRLLGNREDAEDLVQDAFAHLHARLAAFRGDCAVRTFVFQITLNLCRDALRRRKRRGPPPLPLEAAREIAAPDAAPAARDELLALRRALDDLPPRQQSALLLKVYEGLSYAEIARVLGTTAAAARVYAYLARRSLRRRLGGEGA